MIETFEDWMQLGPRWQHWVVVVGFIIALMWLWF